MKNHILRILTVMMVVCLGACIFTACGKKEETVEPTYTVTYADGVEDEDITVPTDATKYKAGDTVTVKAGIERDGYTFEGWSNGTNIYEAGDTFKMPARNVTLTAQWEVGPAPTYTVTYADGVEDEVITVPTDTNAYEEGATVTVAGAIARGNGYAFGGWSDGTTTYQPGNTFAMPAHSVTLTAVWEHDGKFSVIYDANAGDDVIANLPYDSTRYESGNTVTVKGAIERDGYAFKGWEYNGHVYQEGETFQITEDVTLVAKWAATYTVTYVSGVDGITAPTDSKAYEEGENVTVLEALSRNGYKFKGWSDGDATYQAGAIFQMPAKNVTLTAVWAEAYTVKYSDGAGNVVEVPVDSTQYEEGENVTLKSLGDFRYGYIFDGWSYGDNTYQAGASFQMPAENVTFTAQWIDAKEAFAGVWKNGTTTLTIEAAADAYTIGNATVWKYISGSSVDNFASSGYIDQTGDKTFSFSTNIAAYTITYNAAAKTLTVSGAVGDIAGTYSGKTELPSNAEEALYGAWNGKFTTLKIDTQFVFSADGVQVSTTEICKDAEVTYIGNTAVVSFSIKILGDTEKMTFVMSLVNGNLYAITAGSYDTVALTKGYLNVQRTVGIFVEATLVKYEKYQNGTTIATAPTEEELRAANALLSNETIEGWYVDGVKVEFPYAVGIDFDLVAKVTTTQEAGAPTVIFYADATDTDNFVTGYAGKDSSGNWMVRLPEAKELFGSIAPYSGYTFKGWFTKTADGLVNITEEKAAGQLINLADYGSADYEIHARWKEVEYTDGNGGAEEVFTEVEVNAGYGMWSYVDVTTLPRGEYYLIVTDYEIGWQGAPTYRYTFTGVADDNDPELTQSNDYTLKIKLEEGTTKIYLYSYSNSGDTVTVTLIEIVPEEFVYEDIEVGTWMSPYQIDISAFEGTYDIWLTGYSAAGQYKYAIDNEDVDNAPTLMSSNSFKSSVVIKESDMVMKIYSFSGQAGTKVTVHLIRTGDVPEEEGPGEGDDDHSVLGVGVDKYYLATVAGNYDEINITIPLDDVPAGNYTLTLGGAGATDNAWDFIIGTNTYHMGAVPTGQAGKTDSVTTMTVEISASNKSIRLHCDYMGGYTTTFTVTLTEGGATPDPDPDPDPDVPDVPDEPGKLVLNGPELAVSYKATSAGNFQKVPLGSNVQVGATYQLSVKISAQANVVVYNGATSKDGTTYLLNTIGANTWVTHDFTITEYGMELYISNKTSGTFTITLKLEGETAPAPTQYDVTYSLGEAPGNAPDAVKVDAGTTITLPEAQSWEGHVFLGWQVEGEQELRAALSSYEVNGNVTITAIWMVETDLTVGEEAEIEGKDWMESNLKTIYLEAGTYTIHVSGEYADDMKIIDDNGTLKSDKGESAGDLILSGKGTTAVFTVTTAGVYTLKFIDMTFSAHGCTVIIEKGDVSGKYNADLHVGVKAEVETSADWLNLTKKTIYLEAGTYTIHISGANIGNVKVLEDNGLLTAAGNAQGDLLVDGATTAVFTVAEDGLYTLRIVESTFTAVSVSIIVHGGDFSDMYNADLVVGEEAEIAGKDWMESNLKTIYLAVGTYTIHVSGEYANDMKVIDDNGTLKSDKGESAGDLILSGKGTTAVFTVEVAGTYTLKFIDMTFSAHGCTVIIVEGEKSDEDFGGSTGPTVPENVLVLNTPKEIAIGNSDWYGKEYTFTAEEVGLYQLELSDFTSTGYQVKMNGDDKPLLEGFSNGTIGTFEATEANQTFTFTFLGTGITLTAEITYLGQGSITNEVTIQVDGEPADADYAEDLSDELLITFEGLQAGLRYTIHVTWRTRDVSFEGYQLHYGGQIYSLEGDGVDFYGWFVATDATTASMFRVDTGAPRNIMISVYQSPAYTVHFEAEDATVPSDITVLEGETFESAAEWATATATKKGFTFLYWYYLNKNQQEVKIEGDEIVFKILMNVLQTQEKTLTLYAKFEAVPTPDEFTLHFEAEGADVPSDITYLEGATFSSAAEWATATATKANYTFLYWYYLDGQDEVQLQDGDVLSDILAKLGGTTLTVYAKFQLNAEIEIGTVTPNGWWLHEVEYPETLKVGEVLTVTGDLTFLGLVEDPAEQGVYINVYDGVLAALSLDNFSTQVAYRYDNFTLGELTDISKDNLSSWSTDWFGDLKTLQRTGSDFKLTINIAYVCESYAEITYVLTGTVDGTERTFIASYTLNNLDGAPIYAALAGEDATLANAKASRYTLAELAEKAAEALPDTAEETDITVGTAADSAYGDNSVRYETNVKAGQVLTVNGTLKTNEDTNYNGVAVMLYPVGTYNQKAYNFRLDNWVNGPGNTDVTIPEYNFKIALENTTDFGNFPAAKKDAEITITVDYLAEDTIVITYVITSNAVESYTATQTYTITAIEGNLLAAYTVQVRPDLGYIENAKATVGDGTVVTPPAPTPVTVSVTISDYATEQEWQDTKQNATVNLDPIITATMTGGSNTGYYAKSSGEWRLYQTDSGVLTIKAEEGYTISTIKVTFAVSNNGTFRDANQVSYASGETIEIGANSATFTAVTTTSGKTNGQIKITAIEVVYIANA